MATISELIKEKNSLPIGNIYRKRINGSIYSYYQYFENGKRYSKIVSEEEAKKLILAIKRRKDIEAQIKLIKQKEKPFTLSKAADKLTGQVMCGDIPVAKFENGVLVSINQKLAPLVIKRTKSIEAFLKLRVIDMTRTNARILKKALNINVDEEYKASLYAYALSISDNYWFKPKHSKLKYTNVDFNNDVYADMSLTGDTLLYKHRSELTPEITTPGSFEKGWKLINDEWWLYKTGNPRQIFSELFCYQFAKLIDLPTAVYELDGDFIRSKNFASVYNFEPIAALAGNDDNYQTIFNILFEIDKDIAKQYLKMIFFDSVVYNIDRHNENLGLMRDRKNGKIISLAPNFDNNLALISTIDYLKEDPKTDRFVKTFVDFLLNNKDALLLYKEIEFKTISLDDVRKCLSNIPLHVDIEENIVNAIVNRYNYLKHLF